MGLCARPSPQGDRYRVQFTKQELMTALVEDVWVMPVNPADNLPDASEWRRHSVLGAVRGCGCCWRRQRHVQHK